MLLCKYPIRILHLDDDNNFIRLLGHHYEGSNKLTEFYNNVEEFTTLLKKYNHSYFLDNYLSNVDEEKMGQRFFSIDICNIHKEYMRKNRNQQIGIIVIDQTLPNTDGISVLRTLAANNFFTILLTATTDNQTAIDAFNEGIIDAFISKNIPNMLEELDRLIEKGTENYFKRVSQIILQTIKQDTSRKSALGEPKHQELLRDIIQKYDVNEYYLLDSFGSYMLVGVNGKVSFLLVNDSASIPGQLDILNEHKISENIIKQVSVGKKMLYWPIVEASKEIQNYIFDSKYLGKNNEFTFAILSQDSTFGERVFSLYSSK